MISRRRVLVGGATLAGTSVLAGCLSGNGTDGDFQIERIAFSRKNPENVDSYEDVQDERTFTTDEQFWVLVATGYVPTDDEGRASLEYTFRTDTPVFTDGEPRDVDDYEEKPAATYASGEYVWLYTEVVNAPTDDSGKATLEYTFEVVPPTGEPWEPSQKINRWERVQDDEALIYWREFTMYEDDPKGAYEVTLTIEDRVSGRQIQTTETFVGE